MDKKRGSLGFLDSVIILASGIAGASIGWDLGTASLARFAAKGAARLGANERGPVLIGYTIGGLFAGMIVAYIGVRLWRRFHGARGR